MGALLNVNGKLLLVGSVPLSVALASAVIAGNTLTLTLNDIQPGNVLAKGVYARAAGRDDRDVPVLLSYTGDAPTNVQARVVDADSKAVIRDWTTITSAQVNTTSKTILGYLPTVPIGMNYNLQIRDGNQPANTATISNGTRRWGVGVGILWEGQSNSLGTLTAGNYDSPIPGSSRNEYTQWNDILFPGVYFGPGGFTVPYNLPGSSGSTNVSPQYDGASGGGGKFLRLVAAGLKRKYGRDIPVCLTIWAFNSSGLEPLTPYTGNNIAIYTNTGFGNDTTGFRSQPNCQPGDYEIVIMHQGEAANGQARADRVESMKANYRGHLEVVAPAGRTAENLTFIPAVLGVYTQVPNVERIRGAVFDLESYAKANNWPKVRAGWNCIDLDPSDGGDGLHFQDVNGGMQYKKMSLYRAIQDVYKALGVSTFGGTGPRFLSVTRSGNVATVKVTLEGGTALAPRKAGTITGWYANTASDFSGADIAVTAAISGADTVDVTFPAGTVFPVYLKHMGGKIGTAQSYHPDVSNPVCNNAAYPEGAIGTDVLTGIPMMPTPDPIVVN